MKNYILITGALGMLGSQVLIACIAQGFNVIATDSVIDEADDKAYGDLIKDVYDSPSDVIYMTCDLCSRSMTDRMIDEIQKRKLNVTAICHFAGSRDLLGDARHEELNMMLSLNVITLANALRLAERLRPERFVFPDSVYSMMLNDRWTYFGLSKKICRDMINRESLFNNETKFISIIAGDVIGRLPYFARVHCPESVTDQILTACCEHDGWYQFMTSKSPAWREGICPVSCYEYIGCVIYALTFSRCFKDTDFYCGDTRGFAAKFVPARDFLLLMTDYDEIVDDATKDMISEPKCSLMTANALRKEFIESIPEKLLKRPAKILCKEKNEEIVWIHDLWFETLRDMLKNAPERNGDAWMILLLKFIIAGDRGDEKLMLDHVSDIKNFIGDELPL
jgi:hypothetical protein